MNEEKKKVTGIRDLSLGRKDVYFVDPRILIEEPGFNVRQQFTGIEELADNIYENGQKRAIDVYKKHDDPEHLYISDGARRKRALMVLLGRGQEVRAKVNLTSSNAEKRTIDLIICNDGVPLSMLEQGRVFIRLVGFGYEAQEISTKTSKALPYIHNAMKLANTPKKVQELIISNMVPDTTVLLALQNTQDEDELVKILSAAVEQAKEIGGGTIKRGAVTRAVSQNIGKPRISPVKKLKELDSFIEENSVVMNGNKGLAALRIAAQYMRGEVTLDEVLSAIR